MVARERLLRGLNDLLSENEKEWRLLPGCPREHIRCAELFLARLDVSGPLDSEIWSCECLEMSVLWSSTASPLLLLGHSGGSFVTSGSPIFSSLLKAKSREVLIPSWTDFLLLSELLALAGVSDWLPLETASSNLKSCRVASANRFLLFSYSSSNSICFSCLARRMAASFCFSISSRFTLAIT